MLSCHSFCEVGNLEYNKKVKVKEARVILGDFCTALTALGDTSVASHVDSADDDQIHENLGWWAEENFQGTPRKARLRRRRTPQGWS
jgi:hypothetical protein